MLRDIGSRFCPGPTPGSTFSIEGLTVLLGLPLGLVAASVSSSYSARRLRRDSATRSLHA